MPESIGSDAHTEEAIVETASRRVDRVELQLAAQAQLSAKSEAVLRRLHDGPRADGSGYLLWNDLLATLGATTRKNLLTTGGLHAGTESRGALAAELAGLISAFHMIGSKAADLSEKRAGRVRRGRSGCQYNPVRNG
jgi:hypothetical protein